MTCRALPLIKLSITTTAVLAVAWLAAGCASPESTRWAQMAPTIAPEPATTAPTRATSVVAAGGVSKPNADVVRQ